MFTDPTRERQMAAHLRKLEVILDDLPGLTDEARELLLSLALGGTTVDVYQHGASDWVLEVRAPGSAGDLDPRWTIAAWNIYAAGGHSMDLDALCMCRSCQTERHERAALYHWRTTQGGA